MSTNLPEPTDIHVGKRIRMRRMIKDQSLRRSIVAMVEKIANQQVSAEAG